MILWLELLGSLGAGVVLGLGFFWGLWVTVGGIPRSRRPGLRVAGSLLVRFALVLFVFYLLARHGGWPHTVAAAVGFTLPRFWIGRHSAGSPVREEP